MGNLRADLPIVKYPFLAGGEMGNRTRERNWENSDLGSPDKWPIDLRIILNTLFRNKLPTFLFWGADLVTFYNDAAMSVFEDPGSPRNILGLSAKNSLPKGWEVLEPAINQVFETGESILLENKLMLFSKKEHENHGHWTFSFTCVVNEYSKPEGVMLTGIETIKDPEIQSELFAQVSEHVDQLNYIIDAAELGTWNINPETNKIDFNSRASEWFGLSGEGNMLEVLLKNIVAEDRQSIINEVESALKPDSDGAYQVEYSIVNPVTKEKRRLLSKGKAQFNKEDRVFRFGGIFQDITEQYSLLEKLKTTEGRLTLALETAEMGTWELDIPSQEITHSPKLAELLGYEKSTILGVEEMSAHVHPEDLPYLNNEFMPQLMKEGRMEIEYRIIQQSGEIIWVRNHSKLIHDENRVVIKLIGTLYDITEQKDRQTKIETSEQNLRTIVESGPFPIAVYSAKEQRLEMANQAWVSLIGRGDHLVGKSYLEIFPDFEHQAFYSHMKDVFKTGNNFQSEQERADLLKNGVLTTYYFNYTITPIKDGEGKVVRVMNSAVDVTEFVLAKIKIEESEASFRLLANSIPQFVWSANGKGVLLYVNRESFNYTGLSMEELTGMNFLNIIHEKDLDITLDAIKESVKSGNEYRVEHRFRRYDGVYRWQLSRAVPLKDTNGEIQMWVGTSTDIQDMKEQEELKDFFISMASHELKTPITSLKAYVQILLSNYAESDDLFLGKSLKIADKQIIKLTNLISELLDISKIKSGKLNLNIDHFAINELVAETVDEFSIMNPDYKINCHCETGLPVQADSDRITQVVTNFLSNAIKYSSDSKIIDVTCRLVKNEVEVSVRDYGLGINKEEMSRIFERFFRGAGSSESTIPGFGIGLFIAQDIIKRHGGRIGVESERGKGASFYFTLPLMEADGRR